MAVEQQRVLLVDDDPAMLRLLAKWVENAGYRTTRAGDGRQAIAAIEAECPHIVITDWEMPHIDGLDLCRWVRSQKLPHYVYMFFLTGRNGLEDIVKGLNAGADDFLKKPIDPNELLARLRAAHRVIDLERRLSILASCDGLTGLATQRTFYEHLHREWTRAKRNSSPLTSVMIDIDFFKRINDTYGHPAGDEVIRRVAAVLRENTRTADLVSRYGGEEFCVAMPDTDEAQAIQWAGRVRELIAANHVQLGERQLCVTASFGVAQRMDDMQSPEELVDMADQALLVAKRSGRDRVIGYGTLQDVQQGTPFVDRFAALPARSVMTNIVAGLNQDDTVGAAARFFLRFRISSAPVIDRQGKLVGILSERDLMTTTLKPQWWTIPIQQVMRRNVVCYDEQTPVAKIYEFLGRVSIRSVVIVKDWCPVGMISRGSLLRWFVNSLAVGRPTAGSELLELASDSVAKSEVEPVRPRDRMLLTATALCRESGYLEQLLRNGEGDLLPGVIGGVSRMQEMVNDLLSSSRYANDGNELAIDRGTFASFNSENDYIVQQGLAGLLAELQTSEGD